MLTPEQIKTIDKQIAVLEPTKKEGMIIEESLRDSHGPWRTWDGHWDFKNYDYRVRLADAPTRIPPETIISTE